MDFPARVPSSAQASAVSASRDKPRSKLPATKLPGIEDWSPASISGPRDSGSSCRPAQRTIWFSGIQLPEKTSVSQSRAVVFPSGPVNMHQRSFRPNPLWWQRRGLRPASGSRSTTTVSDRSSFTHPACGNRAANGSGFAPPTRQNHRRASPSFARCPDRCRGGISCGFLRLRRECGTQNRRALSLSSSLTTLSALNLPPAAAEDHECGESPYEDDPCRWLGDTGNAEPHGEALARGREEAPVRRTQEELVAAPGAAADPPPGTRHYCFVPFKDIPSLVIRPVVTLAVRVGSPIGQIIL